MKPVGQLPNLTMATLPLDEMQFEPEDLNPVGHDPSRSTLEELLWASKGAGAKLDATSRQAEKIADVLMWIAP